MSMPLATLNALPVPQARQDLLSCCASPQWADLVIAGRPFKDAQALRAASDDAIAQLPWDQVRLALDAHPRIGERSRAAGREAAWSSAEQAAAAPDDAATAAALVQANLDYEQRFGHVFLICATGLSAGQILSAARSRLANQPQAEQQLVRHELAAIAGLRLSRLVSP